MSATDVKTILEDAKLLALMESRRKTAHDQFKNDLYFNFANGLFKADGTLLALVNESQKHYEEIVLPDENLTPILISDIDGFKKELALCFNEASRRYLNNVNAINRTRSKEGLVNV